MGMTINQSTVSVGPLATELSLGPDSLLTADLHLDSDGVLTTELPVGSEVHMTTDVFQSLDDLQGNNTSNGSLGHNTSIIGLGTNAVFMINCVVFVLACVSVMIHIPLLVIIKRCRKITPSFRLLSINFICCSLLYFIIVMVMTIYQTFLKDTLQRDTLQNDTLQNDTLHSAVDYRMFFSATIYTLTLCAVGGLALERLLRVTHPLVGSRLLTTRNVMSYIVFVWMFGFLTPLFVFLRDFIFKCNFKLLECDLMNVVENLRIVFCAIFISISALICVSCYKIYKTVKSLQVTQLQLSVSSNLENQPPQKKQFATTRYVLKVILIYVVIHVPVVIHTIIFLLFPEWKTNLTVSSMKLLSFVCSLVSFYVTLHFYIWKFKECKLVFLMLFCSWNRRYGRKTQDLKYDVYDIPVGVKSTASSTGFTTTETLSETAKP